MTILSILAGGLVRSARPTAGTLVYEYQFNVEDMKGSTVWDETEVDQFPGDRKKPPPAPRPRGTDRRNSSPEGITGLRLSGSPTGSASATGFVVAVWLVRWAAPAPGPCVSGPRGVADRGR